MICMICMIYLSDVCNVVVIVVTTTVRLKYRGMGDITVFLLFGPMLMQVSTSVLLIIPLHPEANPKVASSGSNDWPSTAYRCLSRPFLSFSRVIGVGIAMVLVGGGGGMCFCLLL